MTANLETMRVVRTYAIDLAIGDTVVDSDYEHVGTVDSVPTIENGMVIFNFYDGEQTTLGKSWPGTKVVRIKIARRTS